MKRIFTLLALVGLAYGANAQAVEPENLMQANPGGGDFNSASTWGKYRLPQDGDSIVIPAGVTVTFGATTGPDTTIRTFQNMVLDIFGTLQMNEPGVSSNRNKLYLMYSAASLKPAIRLYNGSASVVRGTGANKGKSQIIVVTNSTYVNQTTEPSGGNNNMVYQSTTQPTSIVGPAQTYQTGVSPAGGGHQQGFEIGLTTLPAVLVWFDAVKQGNQVVISWRTQQEQNTKLFQIEKSFNGVDYRAVGTINAAVNSSVPMSYSFSDASSNVLAYYRVRVISQDGQSAMTGVKAIRGTASTAKIGVYPNPVRSVANIVVDNPDQQAFSLSVFNRNGQLLALQRAAAGTNFVRLDVNRFAAGDYIIDVLFANGSKQHTKMIVAQY